jgi:hypothetical protein
VQGRSAPDRGGAEHCKARCPAMIIYIGAVLIAFVIIIGIVLGTRRGDVQKEEKKPCIHSDFAMTYRLNDVIWRAEEQLHASYQESEENADDESYGCW